MIHEKDSIADGLNHITVVQPGENSKDFDES
jgi:hypothetical protein